eukprot:CAMPEP_0172434414 /NCGR_PEP_ID=MMETSP1064-20121228/70618_1 /TAXON_ID=202472 /ORGANISM="Aulacoseira subarctica , Strain CCAP 1002/5" /LENGTH=855 /DNA_ID=CAMNT_0013182629 /DNA_START=33 /DNA_END=2600 /DNA_ORIENTATION=-
MTLEYAHVNNDQLDELEYGEIDQIDYESQELVDDGGILMESKRRARTARAKRILFWVLTVASLLALFGVGMIVGRNVYIQKTINSWVSKGNDLKKNVDNLCSSKAIATIQGVVKCKDICTVASCCHASESDEEDNCFNTFPDFCEDYISCNILQKGSDIPDLAALSATENSSEVAPSVEVPMARSPVSEACQPELLENPEARQICKDLCQSFTCCFLPDPATGNTCYDSDPNCREWGRPCGNLFNLESSQGVEGAAGESQEYKGDEDHQDMSGLQSTIDLACDFHRFPETRAECDELCDVATCCFESPHQCAVLDQCATTYSSCKILYDDFFDEPGYNDKFYFNGAVFTAAEVERHVYDTCVATDLSVQEQRRDCETACEPANCCYIDGEDGCKGEKICDSFVECGILLQLGTTPGQNSNSGQIDLDPAAADKNFINEQSPAQDQSTNVNENAMDNPSPDETASEWTEQQAAAQVEQSQDPDQELEKQNTSDLEGNEATSEQVSEVVQESSEMVNDNGTSNHSPDETASEWTEQQAAAQVQQSQDPDQELEKQNTSDLEGNEATSEQVSDVVQESSEMVNGNGTSEQVVDEGSSSPVDQGSTTDERNADPDLELDKQNTSSLLNALNAMNNAPPSEATSEQVSDVVQESPEVVNDNGTPEQVVDEGNSSPMDQGTTTEENTGVTEDQYQTVDQSASSENGEGPDNEEIFIHGEKYTKAELAVKVQDTCADLSLDENRQACADLCEPAECCNADGLNGCKGDPFCDAFVSCSTLTVESGNAVDGKVFFVDGHKYTASEMERKVHDKCAVKDLSIQKNRDACGDLCKLGKCCFMSGEKSCKGDQFCSAFTDCEELIL